MKKNIIRAVKLIIFSSILFTTLYLANAITEPKYTVANSSWPTTASYNQFYQMKKNTVDVLFLGSSVCVNAFNPQVIYDEYGIRSYNLGSEQQSVFLSYYWLKEALRYQKPKAVVLETKFFFPIHTSNSINTVEGLTRKCIDAMHFSPVKAEEIDDLCTIDEKFVKRTGNTENAQDTRLSYLLTNIRYHARWKELAEVDFKPSQAKSQQLKGYSALFDGGLRYTPFTPSDDSAYTAMDSLMSEYLDKIRTLCDQNGIKLVFARVPGDMDDGKNNAIVKYCSEYDIPFYNFAEKDLWDQLNVDTSTDRCNGHCNVWGAEKISRLMGSFLKNDIKVPSVDDDQWNDTEEYYQYMKNTGELARTSDIDEYLSKLDNKNYDIFLSAKGDASKALKSTTADELKNLGLKVNLADHQNSTYYAVIQNGTGKVIEKADDSSGKLTHSGTVRDRNVSYTVTSQKEAKDEVSSSIIIDGSEYSNDKTGLNIVVYDERLMKVIDAVNFNTSSSDGQTAKRQQTSD